MKRNLKIRWGFCLSLALLASCSQSDDGTSNTTNQQISFTGIVHPSSRATESAFEDEDDISVFAFKEGSGGFTSDSYATNVRYQYMDGEFHAVGQGIVYPQEQSLAFWAIYPYCESAAPAFTFEVQEDQRRVLNYSHSDLMTASTSNTTSTTPSLAFNHRLSCVTVNLTFEDTNAKAAQLNFTHVQKSASVNMAETTFQGIGEAMSTIRATPNGEGHYKVILPPQTIAQGTEFVEVTTEATTEAAKTYRWKVPKDLVLASGSRYTYNLNISKVGQITFTSDIDPWGKPDEIEAIIPPAILDSIEKYIPIYRGDTPPNVEGTYLMEPNTAVYCQDGGFAPGYKFMSTIIKLYNQDMEKRTLELDEKTVDGNSFSKGIGSFISGTGDNFTVYFDSEGESKGVYMRTADVYSGTITKDGIKDLYSGFVIVEKGPDPDGLVMKEGFVRLFKDSDGLSNHVDWDQAPSVRSRSATGTSPYSFMPLPESAGKLKRKQN